MYKRQALVVCLFKKIDNRFEIADALSHCSPDMIRRHVFEMYMLDDVTMFADYLQRIDAAVHHMSYIGSIANTVGV